jgi:hypothetical protein
MSRPPQADETANNEKAVTKHETFVGDRLIAVELCQLLVEHSVGSQFSTVIRSRTLQESP